VSVSDSLGPLRTVQLPQGPLSYRECGAGEPVVLLHGFLVNGDEWREVVPALAPHVRCITPDMPFGAHEHEMPSTADLSMSGVSDLLASLLDALGVSRATLVGNDAGGVLAQIMVERHRERVSRLVLACCDAFEDFPPKNYRFMTYLPHVPGSLLMIALAMLAKPIRRSRFGHAPAISADPPLAVRASYLTPPLRRPIRRDIAKVLRAISPQVTLGAAEAFPSFAEPVLVLWAGRDEMFDPSVPARLADAFPNSTLETVEDSRIYIPEDAPLALADSVLRFIAAHPLDARDAA
jgi:pimeloyl-ACP methyl ester carboxylesterase